MYNKLIAYMHYYYYFLIKIISQNFKHDYKKSLNLIKSTEFKMIH